MYDFFFKGAILCALVLCACDLQPKIASIPDNIAMFIEDRYPALLADPDTQPEIYNSAVTDYGVYASPELYGSANIDDYVLYASVDDYVLVPETQEVQENNNVVEERVTVSEAQQQIEQEIKEDYLIVPTYGTPDIIVEEKPIIIETKQDKKDSDIIIVSKGDTVYSLARKNNMTVAEFAEINNLHEPYVLSIGQKLSKQKSVVKKEVPNIISKEKIKETKPEKTVVKNTVKPNSTKRVDVQEITVQKGDTLYSLSRKYEIPVNDLAVMNKLSSPFVLSVGQNIKVPKLDNVKTVSVSEIKVAQSGKPKVVSAKKATDNKITGNKKETVKSVKPIQKTVAKNANIKESKKISSNPKKQLPKITARSASKFSWPLRGKILSGYGAKNNGLFNDGINVSAPVGSVVKAAENGVVAYAGNEVKGMGNLIIIQHSDGWMTIYAHLDSMSVKRGARVNVGTPIGRVGQTGKVDKPQLHFEIRKGTKAYNPIQYLKK